MIGRIQIVKSLLIPQITYLITVASMPKAILKKIEHLTYKFIWNSITEKVKRKTLIKNYKNGGLNMIDLQAHIKTIQSKWVLKLMDKYRRHFNECMWRQRGHFYMISNVYDSKVTRGKGEAHVALY